MDTISTILGPSATLFWPLVGGSLASDCAPAVPNVPCRMLMV